MGTADLIEHNPQAQRAAGEPLEAGVSPDTLPILIAASQQSLTGRPSIPLIEPLPAPTPQALTFPMFTNQPSESSTRDFKMLLGRNVPLVSSRLASREPDRSKSGTRSPVQKGLYSLTPSARTWERPPSERHQPPASRTSTPRFETPIPVTSVDKLSAQEVVSLLQKLEDQSRSIFLSIANKLSTLEVDILRSATTLPPKAAASALQLVVDMRAREGHGD